jgi:hypothetical protein
MSAARVRLGDWTCPSGNNVIAYYCRVRNGLAVVSMEWDSPPPLTPIDEVYYLAVIQPAVTARVAEYTEQTGRRLTVML